jgi:hypothetical protein
MPRSTSATGKSTSFMRRNTVSSRPSRLTVTRCRPAALSARALRVSRDPLVVSVRSSGKPSTVRSPASCSIRISMFLRSSGSPPVRRILRTPWPRTAGQPGDLFKAQQGAVRQVGVVLVEDILGHAVAAAEVAAVGDADAQIAQRSAQGVAEQTGGRDRLSGTRAGCDAMRWSTRGMTRSDIPALWSSAGLPTPIRPTGIAGSPEGHRQSQD